MTELAVSVPTVSVPTVAIILLNWNSGALGAAAARSALQQTWSRIELVVVDNASEDDSLAKIQAEVAELAGPVTWVNNDANLGFSGGMNAGIAATTAPFVLPLNCDATLDPDYVSILMREMDDPRISTAGGLIRSALAGLTGPIQITPRMRTTSLPTDRRLLCDKVNGACPLHRRSALEQASTHFGTGIYDATYDTYGEDLDLAKRLARLGWRIVFNPNAGADHIRSFASAPRLADKRGRLRSNNLANRHRNISRHADHPWLQNAIAYGEDVAFAARQLIRGDREILFDMGQAWRMARLG